MTYARPADREGALRLHLNENTGGCSPAVIDAIGEISAQDVAVYPDYALLSRECAAYLGVSEAHVVLTNGLDEGLLAATVSAFRFPRDSAAPPEAIIPGPAFEMYSVFVNAAGGRVVSIPPGAAFAFPLEGVCSAIGDRTRIIFLTSPNNPTGQLVPRDAIREIARCSPPNVTIVVDEAYYDFCGETFLNELGIHPNVVIGRTFAKAHGLAGLRAGCLIGDPGRIAAAREVVPPYSLSVFAVAGWRAALRDREHLRWYREQVAESRELLYAACERLGLPYWKSAGNFVLIHVARSGEPAAIVRRFAERGILVRDRSRDPGCAGCIRITAGVVRHTQTAVEALEDVCAVP
jgi:histidinol-phosphate aminotransferase